jgi:hypothetical protein
MLAREPRAHAARVQLYDLAANEQVLLSIDRAAQ